MRSLLVCLVVTKEVFDGSCEETNFNNQNFGSSNELLSEFLWHFYSEKLAIFIFRLSLSFEKIILYGLLDFLW